MNLDIRKVLILGLLLALSGTVGLAQLNQGPQEFQVPQGLTLGPGAQVGQGSDGHGLRQSLRLFGRFFDLSDEQIDAIIGVVEDTHAEIAGVHQQIKGLEVELAQLLRSGQAGAGQVGAIVLDIHALKQSVVALREAMGSAIEVEMDEGQLARLERVRQVARLQVLFPAMKTLGLIPVHPAGPGDRAPEN